MPSARSPGVVEATHEVDADLLLIAGDLFDNNRVDDSNIDFVYRQFERLRCPVVMLPGNHDVHDESSVWNRFDFDEAGEHVHGLMSHDGNCVTLDEIGARVWGKAMAEHAPENYPLVGVPERHRPFIGTSAWRTAKSANVVSVRVRRRSPAKRSALRASTTWPSAISTSGGITARARRWPSIRARRSRISRVPTGGYVAVVNLCPRDGVRVESRRISRWERVMERSNGGFPF